MKTNLQVLLRTPGSHEEFHVEVRKMKNEWENVGVGRSD